MDAFTALIAELLAALRATVAPPLCPGRWAWATTILGVGVGLLPAAGAIAAARFRRRTGAAVVSALMTGGAGLVTAGLAPLLLVTATGQVFAAAAAGGPVPGLARRDLRDLDGARCFGDSQASYLGEGSVGAAFDPSRPLLLGVAVLAFGVLPLVTALFVAAQARLALRCASRWPARSFWLPVPALPVLTAATPAGAAAHLWLGATAGAAMGVLVVLLARPSIAAAARRGPATRAPVGVAPSRTPWARRAATRFAARVPVSPVVLPPERTPSPAQQVHRPPGRVPRPTLAVPQPRGPQPPVRFRLVRRLGSGGFGRVWLAHDAQLRRPVALKAAHAPDDDTERRIRREAKALAAVRHEHCVRILDLVHSSSDLGLADLDGLVIVMEYVAGCSLGELVRERGVLDDIAAARVWAGLAGGLDAAHRQGVLHRDVKPANVVVDANGRAHLIDFGIARSTGDATLTLAGWILGTPDFLAPEVAGGASATPASDAWQLAATISFAMTGHPPRGRHADAQSGLRAAASGAALTHLPRRTAHQALLQAALDPDPDRRPAPAVVQLALAEWLRRTGSPLTGVTVPR